MKYHILAFGAGFLLDQLFGDPYFLPHPIRLIGKGIETGERFLRKAFPDTQRGQLAAGTVLGIGIPILSFAISFSFHSPIAHYIMYLQRKSGR